MSKLCCLDAVLKTHDTYVPDYQLQCDKGSTLYTIGAIGDYKELELTYQYDTNKDLSDSCSYSQGDCSDSSTETLPDGLEIFYNIWLSTITGEWIDKMSEMDLSETDAGWYFQYDALLHTVGALYDLSIYTDPEIHEDNNKNIIVKIELLGCNMFKLHIYFYLIADLGDCINSGVTDNHGKLLKTFLDNTCPELDNGIQSQYNVNKLIKSYLYVIEDTEETYIEHEFPVSFRFYDKDLYDAVTPVDISFELSRAFGIVDDFSIFENTQITATFNSNSIVITNISMWLIKVDEFDNVKTFLENYDYSFANITTNGAVVQLHNHIYAPSNLTITPGVNTIADFFVNTENLDCNAKYKIIAVGYTHIIWEEHFVNSPVMFSVITISTTSLFVKIICTNCTGITYQIRLINTITGSNTNFYNLPDGTYYFFALVTPNFNDWVLIPEILDAVYSNISAEINVSCVPDCCDAQIDNDFADYNTASFADDSIIACVQDRMKASADLIIQSNYVPAGKSYLADCIDAWCTKLDIDPYPVGYAGQYLYRVKQVTVQIREVVENYPNVNFETHAIYDELISTRDLATGVWTLGNANINITETVNDLLLEYEYRNRYEGNQLPIDVRTALQSEPENETTVGGLLQNYCVANSFSQDWSNRNLEVVWRILLDFPDAPVPFQHELISRQRMFVHDYDDVYANPYIDYIQLIHPDTGGIITNPCADLGWCYVKVKALCSGSNSCSGSESASDCCTGCNPANFIAFLDKAIFGISNLLEEESYIAGVLTQLTADEMYDVDIEFGGDCIAWFKLDMTKLKQGQLYKVCGMSKQYQGGSSSSS
jgi:hypothetical protein